MANLLTPEQESDFMKQLEQNSMAGGQEDTAAGLSEEQKQQAVAEGQQMAAADAATGGAGVDAPAPGNTQPPAPQPDPSAQRLSELGFQSVDELAEAYKSLSSGSSQLKEMLTNLVAIKQAEQNADDLNPSDPDYQVKRAIRDEMKPMREKLEADARNRIVQDNWKKSAAGKQDISELMPDIQAYLTENPNLAIANDGFDRAYDAVRSRKYKPEAVMFDDPEFIKKASQNEKIKNAVLQEHLQSISRNGDAVPTTIASGGGTPLTPAKKPPTKMDEAKQGLLAMLEKN